MKTIINILKFALGALIAPLALVFLIIFGITSATATVFLIVAIIFCGIAGLMVGLVKALIMGYHAKEHAKHYCEDSLKKFTNYIKSKIKF